MGPMTKLLAILLALAAPAAAQPAADACRTTATELAGRAFVLTLVPTDGSPQIEVRLDYAGCRTVHSEPLFGDPLPPTAARFYRAPGVGWEMALATSVGDQETDLWLFYVSPGQDRLQLVTVLKPAPTALVRSQIFDWGAGRIFNDNPKFDFRARVFTR